MLKEVYNTGKHTVNMYRASPTTAIRHSKFCSAVAHIFFLMITNKVINMP